jgi:putative tricarboxylic transport membrane protein
VLGFILSPMLEMSFRQSLAMSGGDYTIFFQRPFAVALLAIGLVVLLLDFAPTLLRRSQRGKKPAE